MKARRIDLKRLAAIVAVALTLFGAGMFRSADAAPAGAAEWLLNEETQLLDLHNAYRATKGLEPLARDPLLDAVARDWTARMTLSQELEHRPELRELVEDQVTTDWYRIGENVGYGPSINWLHNAFVASPGHEANITGNYNRIGIGASYDGNGDLWVTVNFLDGPDMTTLPVPPLPIGEPADAWIVSAQGDVIALGNAHHYGDMGHVSLNSPIVTMAATNTANGYWLAASDGGIFTFGSATYEGSAGALPLTTPVSGMVPVQSVTPDSNEAGYWIFTYDGLVIAYGGAGAGLVAQAPYGSRAVDAVILG
jgi:uncharacterized protein YkwD